jgi:2-amino-4-hydroxy-6-hydroxymethyldihydropteridine diphosphokinase
MATVYLGLGSNVGDRGRNLHVAIQLLRNIVTVDAVSSIYQTEPVGFTDQRAFWNMAARVHTPLAPEQLLEALFEIERDMGRRRTFRNAPRNIDLDILLYDDVVLEVPGLTLPHPRMTERGFVLTPLTELAPELRDPRTGDRYRDVLGQGRFEHVEPIGALADLQNENVEP